MNILSITRNISIFTLLCNALPLELRADPLQDLTISNELMAAYSKKDETGKPQPDLKRIEDLLSKLSDKNAKLLWLNNLMLGYYSKVDEKGKPIPDLKNVKRLYNLIQDENYKTIWANNIKMAELMHP